MLQCIVMLYCRPTGTTCRRNPLPAISKVLSSSDRVIATELYGHLAVNIFRRGNSIVSIVQVNNRPFSIFEVVFRHSVEEDIWTIGNLGLPLNFSQLHFCGVSLPFGMIGLIPG